MLSITTLTSASNAQQLQCSLFYSITISQECKMYFFTHSLWLISKIGLHGDLSIKWLKEVQPFGGLLTKNRTY